MKSCVHFTYKLVFNLIDNHSFRNSLKFLDRNRSFEILQQSNCSLLRYYLLHIIEMQSIQLFSDTIDYDSNFPSTQQQQQQQLSDSEERIRRFYGN
jgi:hypothetical protein